MASSHKGRKSSRQLAALMVAATGGLMLRAGSASATSYTWNTTTGDYTVPTDWNPTSGPPGSSDTATVDNGGTVQIQGTDAATPQIFILGDSGGAGTVSMTGGTLGITGSATGPVDASLQLNASGTGTGTFNLSGGTVTVSGGNDTTTVVDIGGGGSGNGTLNILNGGTFNDTVDSGPNNDALGYVFVGGGNTTGALGTGGSGIGIINLSTGGSLSITGTLAVANGAGSKGIVNLNGGTLTTGLIDMGTNASGSGAVYNNGGTITVNAGTSDANDFNVGGTAATGDYGYFGQTAGNTAVNYQIAIAGNNNGTGNYGSGAVSVSGGTLIATQFITMGRANTAGFGQLTISGSGYVNQSNGAGGSGNLLRINGTGGNGNINDINMLGGVFGASNTELDLDFSNAGTNNTTILNLDGGVTQANSVNETRGADSGTLIQINFNGGILRSTGTATAQGFLSTSAGTAAGSGIYVYSGGATIDTNGSSNTISQALLAPPGNGVTTIPVTNGGSGYVGAPLIDIEQGPGYGATAVANMIPDGSGNGTYSVGSITITNPGIGWTSAPSLYIFGGGGTGFTAGTPTIGANSSGGFTVLGNGTGTTITLSASNTYGGSTTVFGGATLVTSTTSGWIPNTPLILSGSTFADSGGAASTTETVSGLTLQPGASQVNETSANRSLALGNITRSVAGSTLRVGPNSGTTGAAGSISTTTANTNGILGGWAFFDGTGQASPTTFAVGAATSGTPTAITGLSTFDDTYGSGADTMVDNSAHNDQVSGSDTVTFTGSTTTHVNSLLFNDSGGAATVNGGDSNAVLSITSGGILVASATGANNTTIGPTGAGITSGNGTDLIVGQFSSGTTTIGLPITGSIGFTKTGGGTVSLTGANSYTGGTFVNAGTLSLTGTSNNISSSSAIRIQPASTLNVSGLTNGLVLSPGQSLFGAGAVTGNVTISGTGGGSSVISGGYGTALNNYPGLLTINGQMNWGSSGVASNNGTYDVKFAAPGGSGLLQTGGTYETWDQIDVTTLNVVAGSGGAGEFTIAPIGNLTGVSAGTYNWAIAQVGTGTATTMTVNGSTISVSGTSSPTVLSQSVFDINSSNFFVNGVDPAFSLYFETVNGNNDVVLSYSTVPEPGTALVAMVGLAPLLLGRPRRSRASA